MAIYNAADSRAFNDSMNALAVTRGVSYSGQWPMHVHSGRAYLHSHYADVGRVYAQQILQGSVGRPSTLALSIGAGDLSNYQRALLTYLMQTTTDKDFDSMMRVCISNNALPPTAGIYFSKTRDAVQPIHETLSELDFRSLLTSMPAGAGTPGNSALSDDVQMASDGILRNDASQPIMDSGIDPASVEVSDSTYAIRVNPPAAVGQTSRMKTSAAKRRKSSV